MKEKLVKIKQLPSKAKMWTLYFYRGNKMVVIFYAIILLLVSVIPLTTMSKYLELSLGITEYVPERTIDYQAFRYYSEQEFMNRTFSVFLFGCFLVLIVIGLFLWIFKHDYTIYEKRIYNWKLIRPRIDTENASEELTNYIQIKDECLREYERKKGLT
jgi:hypothetical protein